ncbi:MAG: hypothetical protein V1754_06695, partial [Pseudomonadota bacterium]
MRKLHIALVTISDLPEGGGNTSRLKRLVHALTLCGHQVEIWNEHSLGIAPSETQEPDGEIGGVKFSFALGTVERGSGFGAISTKIRAVQKLSIRLMDAKRMGEIDLLWLNNLSFYDIQPLTLLARALGIPTVQSYEDERLELVSTEKKIFIQTSLC